MCHRILAIDDDVDFTMLLSKRFASKNLELITAANASEGQKLVKEIDPDLILLDVMLPDRSGVDLIKTIKSIHWDVPVIMVSGYGDTPLVVEAIKAGASDYVQKPIEFPVLWEKINRLIEVRITKDTEKELKDLSGSPVILGKCLQTRQLIREIGKIAPSDATVLLKGESGTGKSLIARVIHDHSLRSNGAFVVVNCAATPQASLESELFGHEKGSLAATPQQKIGKLELADGGTIFFDEIGDLSPELQSKLLRVLQEKKFERPGGVNSIPIDVRVIAATTSSLENAVRKGQFREDLFYWLNVLPLSIPPLRERREDIPILLDYFCNFYSRKYNKSFENFSEEVLQDFNRYDWPGNIRELQNMVERTLVLGRPPQLEGSECAPTGSPALGSTSEVTSLKDLEYRTLMRALEQTGGNISKAARLLEIGRDTIYRRLKKYNIGLKQNRIQS